jgi:hypothetical protein
MIMFYALIGYVRTLRSDTNISESEEGREREIQVDYVGHFLENKRGIFS